MGAVKRNKEIYVAGGSEGSPLKTFEKWNGFRWESLPDMNYKRDELSLVLGPDDQIYAIGGFGELSCLGSGECYREGKWELLPAMKKPRRALASVVMPDGIYAIGGYDGSSYLSSVERFDIRMNKWVEMTSMNYARCTLSAVTSPDYQYIYAMGGFNGAGMQIVERYSVVQNKWEEIKPLMVPRFMHCSAMVID